MMHKHGIYNIPELLITAGALVLVIVLLYLLPSRNLQAQAAVSTEEGISYLHTQAEKNAAEIDHAIFENQREEMLEEISERIAQDPDYVWKALSDINTVILGDSRVGVFESGGFLDSSRVIWEPATAMEEVVDYDRIRAANPRIVVLAFGLNDIGLIHMEPESFAASACSIVDVIQNMLPDAYIYIQSILPPNYYGSETSFTYELVTQWSDAEIAYYKEHGYRYLDINFLVWDYAYLYAADGFHFDPAFYKYWGGEILKQYLYDSMEEEAADDDDDGTDDGQEDDAQTVDGLVSDTWTDDVQEDDADKTEDDSLAGGENIWAENDRAEDNQDENVQTENDWAEDGDWTEDAWMDDVQEDDAQMSDDEVSGAWMDEDGEVDADA